MRVARGATGRLWPRRRRAHLRRARAHVHAWRRRGPCACAAPQELMGRFDTDGDGIIEEGELQFAKNILHGVVKANLGKEEGGVEKYLAELKGDELKARLEEDERAEEEMAKASAQVKARLEERKKKREMLRAKFGSI